MSGFSIELLEDGYRAIDPSTMTRYLIRRAPDRTPLSAGRVARARRALTCEHRAGQGERRTISDGERATCANGIPRGAGAGRCDIAIERSNDGRARRDQRAVACGPDDRVVRIRWRELGLQGGSRRGPPRNPGRCRPAARRIAQQVDRRSALGATASGHRRPRSSAGSIGAARRDCACAGRVAAGIVDGATSAIPLRGAARPWRAAVAPHRAHRQ